MNENRPNILLLLTDQYRHDALGCSGNTVVRTPGMDSLAAEGMRFTSAFTPTSLCSPARASLLTGLYAHNHGLLTNMGNFNGVFDRQLLERVAYTQLLDQAGYAVHHIGKWHLPARDNPGHWGFRTFADDGEYERAKRAEGLEVDRSLEVQRLEWGGDAPFCGRSPLAAEDMQEAWTADIAIQQLEEHQANEGPFMIAASFFGPHFPYSVPAPYDTLYDPDMVERWGNFDETFAGKPLIQQKEMLRWNASHLTWRGWQRVIAHYWGYCTYIDDQIRRILERLETLGLADNTVVVYAADHGDMLGSHRLFNKGMYMYDETYRIPLIVRWPGHIPAKSECDAFVGLVDLMPTMLDIAEVGIPEGLDGRSLLPWLRGETAADWPDDIFAEFHGYESALFSQRMVRTRSWKYVYNPGAEDELYDVESDPGELRNLAPDLGYRHVLRRMKVRLCAWMERTGDDIAADDSWKGAPYDLYLAGRER